MKTLNKIESPILGLCMFIVLLYFRLQPLRIFVFHYKSMGKRLLPDVCGCAVSKDASVDVCSKGICFAGRVLHITCLFSQYLGI